MSKLLFFNDPHTADRPPLGRKDDYQLSIMTKLVEIGELCQVHVVDAAICTGDICHQKRPNRVSHYLVGELGHTFSEYPCPVYVVPGNHDMGPGGLANLNRQPLGTLARLGAVELLTQAKPVVIGDVLVVAREWDAEREGDPNYYAFDPAGVNWQKVVSTKHPILVVHGPVLAPGDSSIYTHITVDQIPGVEMFDAVFSGHVHERLGCHLVGREGPLFVNFGSVGRVSRTQSNFLRRVSVALYDSDKEEVTELVLENVQPGPEVFEAVTPTGEPSNTEEIARLADVLGQGIVAGEKTIDELLAGIENISNEVKQLVVQHLEEAGL